MTPKETIAAAGRAAASAGQTGNRPWFVLLPGKGHNLNELAAFVLANRDAPSEALYGFAAAGRAPCWSSAKAEARVAAEVFRATLLALQRLIPPPEPVRRDWGGERRFERIDERVDGPGDRVDLGERI